MSQTILVKRSAVPGKVKNPANATKAPLATFQFQPQMKTAKA